MDKQQHDDVASVKEYPPSEIYTSDPPPAYMKPRTSAVQIARIAAVTLVAVSFILGFFMLASSYVTATLSCEYQPFPQQEMVEDRPVFQQLVDPLESEETKQPAAEAAPDHQPLNIKLPLQLDFDDIAGAMMDQNTKSRMNCVVEKRRAEEVMDHQPKTVRLPFGVNLTTDPRYEHVTGERMAIFCESGNEHRQAPREQLTPVMVPIPVPQPMRQHPHPLPHLPLPQHLQQPQQGPLPQVPHHMPLMPHHAPQMPQHAPQMPQMPHHAPQLPQHVIQMAQMSQQVPHLAQFVPQMHQVPQQSQNPRFFSFPQVERMPVRPQDEIPLQLVREMLPFLEEGDNRIDLVEGLEEARPLLEARHVIQARPVLEARPHVIEARPVLEARPHVIQARPIQVEEGRQTMGEGRAMHVPHQLGEGVPVPADDVRPPPLPEHHRPHFVQPRSVRSVDELLHRRDKRVRRCACDCNC